MEGLFWSGGMGFFKQKLAPNGHIIIGSQRVLGNFPLD